MVERIKQAGSVHQIHRIQRICTEEGWHELEERLLGSRANRILIGACQPCVYAGKLKKLGEALDLSPMLMDVVDIATPGPPRLKLV